MKAKPLGLLAILSITKFIVNIEREYVLKPIAHNEHTRDTKNAQTAL
jgi:hypothetical protein